MDCEMKKLSENTEVLDVSPDQFVDLVSNGKVIAELGFLTDDCNNIVAMYVKAKNITVLKCTESYDTTLLDYNAKELCLEFNL
jgi:hypothetical protein